MLDSLFSSSITSGVDVDLISFLMCSVASLGLGVVIAYVHTVKNVYSKGFIITIAMLPAAVSVVIMMVNGNVGTGVAVAGAFGLVRFRSLPGTAREISSVFLSMAVGLATGMGYVTYSALFVMIMCMFQLVLVKSKFGERQENLKTRTLRITVPESLNYTNAFDDLFDLMTVENKLVSVKTSNMGSMYRLTYAITLGNNTEEKELIDALRCRNGNLEIHCSQREFASGEL